MVKSKIAELLPSSQIAILSGIASGNSSTSRETLTAEETQSPLSSVAKTVVVPVWNAPGLAIGCVAAASVYHATIPLPPLTAPFKPKRLKVASSLLTSQSSSEALLGTGRSKTVKSTSTGKETQSPLSTVAYTVVVPVWKFCGSVILLPKA